MLIGELTWLSLFGGLGYAFGSQWEVISTFASDFGGLVFGLVILVVGLYLAFRLLRKNQVPSNQALSEQAPSEQAPSN